VSASAEQLLSWKKERLSWMPWMYPRLKASDRAWARAWQAEVHAQLSSFEDVEIAEDAFVAPSARLFAEPGRRVTVGPGACIGHEVFVHGPAVIGADVTLNPRVVIDGGKAGVHLGAGCRVATGARLFAFDHGMVGGQPVREQPVTSVGIRVGADVWIGAGAGITDGVTVGEGAVVAMGAVVTRDVPAGVKVGGVPARVIGER
jgi:acetyltransferase-like isoleucine patch superfamily enzyme